MLLVHSLPVMWQPVSSNIFFAVRNINVVTANERNYNIFLLVDISV